MGEPLLRLVILLPVVCLMIVGGLALLKRLQNRIPRSDDSVLALEAALSLGPGAKLAIVRAGDRQFLIALGKSGISRLGEVGEARS